MMNIKVAARISELGYKKGFVAGQIGIAPGTLSKIIQGNHPTLKVAIKLARFLDSTVEELFGESVE